MTRTARWGWTRGAWLLAPALVGACGDDGGARPTDAAIADAATDAPLDAAIDAPLDAAPAFDAATGQIWIRGAGIDGANSRIVLAFVTDPGGGPSRGNICVPVSADPFGFVAAVQTSGGGNPCQLGGVATFADGTYAVAAGIYVPGQQVPERCANTTVTVAGSGDVTLPAFGACAFTVHALKTGTGAGMIVSTPAGITCGADCMETWPAGVAVSLTAVAAVGSTFVGWSGGCTGGGPCAVSGNVTVTAEFRQNP